MIENSGRRRRTTATKMISIGALSRATNIPVETIRSWERRYGSPAPERKPSGHRLYPAATVERLRRVMRLLAHGHRPGEVIGLTPIELDSMLALSEPAPFAPRPDASAVTPAAGQEGIVEALMRASSVLDRDAIAEELRVAWVRLGPSRFLHEVAGPFMVELGRAWGSKKLGIRHEHLASGCLTDFLRSAREPFERNARGPRVVVAMLPGDEHEGGLLMLSLLLALHGHRVVYLGLETPVVEMAAAARDRDVEVVAVSVSATLPHARANAALTRLRKSLPARVALWVGGSGAPASIKGVERFSSLGELEPRLSGAV